MASIVLDDSTKQLTIGGGQWSAVLIDRFFGGGAIWPAFASDENGDTGMYGTLSITFRGTSIAFFGNTPPPKDSQNIFVSIDGGTPYNTSYEDPSPPTSLQWYQSPILSDTIHTINITHIASTSVDYMVIAAGADTPLRGQRLIVDDGNVAISYEGNWTTDTGRYISRDGPNQGLPYGNSTHQTTTQGASAIFRFTGTSVDVYGLFNWQSLGTLSVLYTIDGSSSTKSYDVSTSTQEYKQGLLQRENTLLYSNDSLTAGDHILKMEVTGCIGQTLALDYILYSPSFDTLAAKPAFTATTSILPSSTGLSSSQSSTSTGGAILNPGTKKHTPVGAIVGGVIGGLAALSLLLLLLLFRKRVFKRNSSTLMEVPAVQSPRIEPYTLTVPNPNMSENVGVLTSQHKSNNSTSTFPIPNGSRSVALSSTSALTSGSAFTSPPAVLAPLRGYNFYRQQQDGGDPTNEGGVLPITAGVLFRSRIQRLQDLVLELNKEVVKSGDGSSRVAELRGRISELMREDETNIDMIENDRRQSNATTLPPPYEPR